MSWIVFGFSPSSVVLYGVSYGEFGVSLDECFEFPLPFFVYVSDDDLTLLRLSCKLLQFIYVGDVLIAFTTLPGCRLSRRRI